MNGKRIIALVAAALVAGLVAGNVVSTFVAPASSAATGTGMGLRLGAVMRDGGARMVDIAAKLTGRSTDAVIADRQAGRSIAQIAGAKGVSAEKVVADTLAARKALLDKAVASGQLTQAQADEALARMKTQLTARVNSTTPCSGSGQGCGAGGGGCGMGGGRGQGRGMMGGQGGCGAGGCTQSPATAQ
ncbi:MAG: hypothetical protein FDZ75_05675 [Actinobacteria bacterium]|nr:MAG: hypothetical protein FDZ75_05675 [Actinomycetota bacterium]